MQGRFRKCSPVSLRPTSSSDAWFILNLLSAVPFLADLSYHNTMVVLESARVTAYCCNEIVLSADQRSQSLVVVWEGTCMERKRSNINCSGSSDNCFEMSDDDASDDCADGIGQETAVWYAGDWTGPRLLQPEKMLSGDSLTSHTHDIVAMSEEGVKAIVVNFKSLSEILGHGSNQYRKYVAFNNSSQQRSCKIPPTISATASAGFRNAIQSLNVIELLESNTGLRKLTAVQKRAFECLFEGPTVYTPGQRLWKEGSTVDGAFIIVAGTVSFVPQRRHGGMAGKGLAAQHRVKQERETLASTAEENLGEDMHTNAVKAMRELRAQSQKDGLREASETDDDDTSLINTEEYQNLTRGLQKFAEHNESTINEVNHHRRGSSSSLRSKYSQEVSLHDLCLTTTTTSSEEKDKSKPISAPVKQTDNKHSEEDSGSLACVALRRSPKRRFANKVLGRMYNRRAFATGLVFSRGHFFGDIEKMVEGLLAPLSTSSETDTERVENDDELLQSCFWDKEDALSLETMTIQECEDGQQTTHTSTLAAGKDGCVVLTLPKLGLALFLNDNPGFLLSLLGMQVVV